MMGALNELALFAGAGGGILGGKLLGWRTVCAVEYDEHARNVLVARQNDGSLEPFPIWDDVSTFDGRPWRGRIDVISGGFPCQDISCAGKGTGIDGERSGLWKEMARIIGEVRPRYCLVENSPMLTSRGLGTVLGDLAAMGYDAKWGVLGAIDAGAPHKRERIWIVGHSDSERREEQPYRIAEMERNSNRKYSGETVADAYKKRLSISKHESREEWEKRAVKRACATGKGWWEAEPGMGRVVDGVAHRVDRLKRIGNGQVPAVVQLAWETLNG